MPTSACTVDPRPAAQASSWGELLGIHLPVGPGHQFTGVALLKLQAGATPMYASGVATDITQEDRARLLDLFSIATSAQQQDERATVTSCLDVQFTVIDSTLTRALLVAKGRASGVVVHLLPLSILVTFFGAPHSIEDVLPAVESFCALLRA